MEWFEGSQAIHAVDEARRVLRVWEAHGLPPASETELVQWTLVTASRGGRFPSPSTGLEVLRELAIVRDREDGTLECLASPVTEFEIFTHLWSSDAVGKQLRTVFSFAVLDSRHRPCIRWRDVPRATRRLPAWIWLQRLGLATWHGEELVLDRRLESFSLDVESRGRVSQKELVRRLEAQQERGEMAEEYVTAREIERLRAAGKPDLAHGVERISIIDAAAGYDINSFELDGSTRHIEVKSSAGAPHQFFISRNELATARRLRRSYWIAWVWNSARLPLLGEVGLSWYQDPARLFDDTDGPWELTPSGWIVSVRHAAGR